MRDDDNNKKKHLALKTKLQFKDLEKSHQQQKKIYCSKFKIKMGSDLA